MRTSSHSRWIASIVLLIVATWLIFGLAIPVKAASTIEFLNPSSPGTTVSGTIQVRVRCTDPVGVWQIIITAGTHGSYSWCDDNKPTTATLQFNWDTTQEPNGTATINVACYNAHSELSGNGTAVIVNNPLYITSVSPTWGNAGVTYVTLTGSGFGSSRGGNSVWFSSSKASTYSSWTDNQIKVQIGAGAQAQTHIKVMVAGVYSNAKAFDVRPHINYISPNAARAGNTVTLSGSSFCNTKGTGKVYWMTAAGTIGTPSANYVSWKQTQIKVKVPSTIPKGNMQIRVYTEGGNSNVVNFQKTN